MNISAFSTIYSYYVTGPPAKSWSLLSDITFKGIHHFINKSSSLTVEDVQRLSTTLKPPVSFFLKQTKFTVPNEYRKRAGDTLEGLFTKEEKKCIGWDWTKGRENEAELEGEWLSMNKNRERVILYLHGGAYYTCNYQILAPQRPFPSAVEDALATYIYLIEDQAIDPKKIVISGDSSGGGLTMALLLAIRDAGLPLPAGGMPISPWIDLTHSLPSILSNMLTDFLPATGFKHAPSPALDYSQLPKRQMDAVISDEAKEKAQKAKEKRKLTAEHDEDERASIGPLGIPVPKSSTDKDMYRIQFYAPNEALKVPMVSPIFDRRRFRGLPPLLVQCGKSERLRDESLYLSLEASGVFDKDSQHGQPTQVTLEVFVDQPHVFQIMFIHTKPTKRAIRNLASFVSEVTGSSKNEAYYLSDQLLSVKEINPLGKTVEATKELLKYVDRKRWEEWKKRLARPSIKERMDEVTEYYKKLIHTT
ncbi:hypothetical protein G6F43_006630 [Rhizopus delemar]|nr:hypothetical protein G6F43_006630 [Rhizopus delemar]